MPAEIDFLGMDRQKSQTSPSITASADLTSHRASSPNIRDFQKAMAWLSPDVLRSVIASNTQCPQGHVPFCGSSTRATAPLTIFYNGNMSVFEATHDMAENVMKMAAGGASQLQPRQQRGFLLKVFNNVYGDMPLLRKKSLQRFLEKRRERLTSLAPYPLSSSSSVGEADGPIEPPISVDSHVPKHQQLLQK